MTTNSNPFKAEGQREIFSPESPQKAEGVVTSNQLVTARQQQVETQQMAQMKKLEGISSFDWKQIPPPIMAELLMKTPFRGKTGEPDYFLQPFQAYRFAIRCYELGLSPLSTEVWYNPQNNMTNVTFEGKLKLARLKNLNLGPPRFEEKHRPFPKGKAIAGFDQDLGISCRMSSGKEDAEYTAWLSEWYVSASPVWKAKPDHMLRVRSAEKCLSFASGIGTSELMDDRDVEIGTVPPAIVSEVGSTEFVPVSPEVTK